MWRNDNAKSISFATFKPQELVGFRAGIIYSNDLYVESIIPGGSADVCRKVDNSRRINIGDRIIFMVGIDVLCIEDCAKLSLSTDPDSWIDGEGLLLAKWTPPT